MLATSALTESLALFLIGDGVLQLVGQQPQLILQRRTAAPTFKLLELYDIEEVYVCADSLAERGLTMDDLLILLRASPCDICRQWANAAISVFGDADTLILTSPF